MRDYFTKVMVNFIFEDQCRDVIVNSAKKLTAPNSESNQRELTKFFRVSPRQKSKNRIFIFNVSPELKPIISLNETLMNGHFLRLSLLSEQL